MLSFVSAVSNIVTALLAISFQIASLSVTRQSVDYACIGIWGGVLMIVTSVLVLLKRPHDRILLSSFLTVLSGAAMLTVYSWNLNRFFGVYTSVEICEFYAPGLLIDPYSCSRLVGFHALFIAIALATILINATIFGIALNELRKDRIYFYRQSKAPPSKLLIHKNHTLI